MYTRSHPFKWGGGKFLIKRRFCQLVIPYLIWSLIACVKNEEFTLGNLFDIILTPDKYYWFLWILFLIFTLFQLSGYFSKKFKMKVNTIIIVMCVLLMGGMVVFNLRICGIQLLSYYFLFYSLGYILHSQSGLQTKKLGILLPLSLIWLFLALNWNMHDLPDWMPLIPHVPKSALQYLYRGVTASIAIYALLGLAPLIIKGNCLFSKWMIKFGIVSLGLYVVHLFYLGYIVDLMHLIIPTNYGIINTSIVFIVVLAISYITIVVLSKKKLTSRYFLGKL